MAIFPIPAQAKEAPDPPRKLTEAAKLARLLDEGLLRVFQIDVADTRKQAIQIGNALQKVANAERACGFCSGEDQAGFWGFFGPAF